MSGIKKFKYSTSDILNMPEDALVCYVDYMVPVLLKRAQRTASKYPTHSSPSKRLEQLREELNVSSLRQKALAVRYWANFKTLSERGYANSLKGAWEWAQSAEIDKYGVSRRNVHTFLEFMEWARAVLDSSNFDSERLYDFFEFTGSREIKRRLDSDRDALLKAYEHFLMLRG